MQRVPRWKVVPVPAFDDRQREQLGESNEGFKTPAAATARGSEHQWMLASHETIGNLTQRVGISSAETSRRNLVAAEEGHFARLRHETSRGKVK